MWPDFLTRPCLALGTFPACWGGDSLGGTQLTLSVLPSLAPGSPPNALHRTAQRTKKAPAVPAFLCKRNNCCWPVLSESTQQLFAAQSDFLPLPCPCPKKEKKRLKKKDGGEPIPSPTNSLHTLSSLSGNVMSTKSTRTATCCP